MTGVLEKVVTDPKTGKRFACTLKNAKETVKRPIDARQLETAQFKAEALYNDKNIDWLTNRA
jgi:hypothetical protein